MKTMQEKLNTVVDLYLNQIVRECGSGKIKMEEKNLEEDIENLDEDFELSNESALDQAMRAASPALKAKATEMAAKTGQDARRLLIRLLNRS